MKLAMTICDTAHAAFGGGEVTRQTYIVDIPDDLVPGAVLQHLKFVAEKQTSRSPVYETLSITHVVE